MIKKYKKILENINNYKILVLGDLILDEYIYGNVERLSSEAPVPIIDVQLHTFSLGGAANAAMNIKNLGAETALIGYVGKDMPGEKILSMVRNSGIDDSRIISDPNRRTTLKSRIVSAQHHQQLLRIDEENRDPVNTITEQKIIKAIAAESSNYDALLISDYSKGLVTDNIAKTAVASFTSKNKPVIVDSKAFDLDRFFGATVLTPNKNEAQNASGIRIENRAALITAGNKLLSQVKSKALLITLGEKGCVLFQDSVEPYFVDSFASEVYDVTGAGDTVASVLTLGIAANLEINDAVLLANIAAGLTVRHFGTVAPSKSEILGVISEIF